MIEKTNMVLYAGPAEADRDQVRAFGRAFGLNRLDNNIGADDDRLTAITVVDEGMRTRYIPYTTRAISWHTDGYYNTPNTWIRGMVLHCAQASATGGANALMDHEIAYILMRDADKAFIEAFMHPEAMTIPVNEDADGHVRPEQTGPVFSLTPEGVDGAGALHMRYTARARNIVWRDDPATKEAVAFLQETLTGDSPYIFRHRMSPGQGLLCNNVLHNRSAFENGDEAQNRLLYRGRSYDRIAGTGPALG